MQLNWPQSALEYAARWFVAPIAGALQAIVETWIIFSQREEASIHYLLAAPAGPAHGRWTAGCLAGSELIFGNTSYFSAQK
jgi:hypothetical protein